MVKRSQARVLVDRFGVVFPDGAVFDCTEGARLFDQDAETRARMVALKNGGNAVRIKTELVPLDGTVPYATIDTEDP
jgi:hypothetical protein